MKACYPGSGAAGYEYCGLMMNVANIEVQYLASWLVTLCPLGEDVRRPVSSEASGGEPGQAVSQHLNHRSGCRPAERLREVRCHQATVTVTVRPVGEAELGWSRLTLNSTEARITRPEREPQLNVSTAASPRPGPM